MRVIFIGGGSIGHLAPLVAVWREIEKTVSGSEAIFYCSDRPADAEYLRSEKVIFHTLPSIKRNFLMPWRMLQTYREARRLLGLYEPHVILSKGGGITVPCCLAAKRMGIPIVLHESDAVPGRATKFLSRWAEVVCYGFPGGKCEEQRAKAKGEGRTNDTSHFDLHTSHFTGNPIRPDIASGSREKGLALTGLSGKRPILLILGGSQGAIALNDVVTKNLDALLAICDVAHITGPGKNGGTKRPGYWHTPIAYGELPDLLAIADVALSRAGAGMIAELAACSVPTILCPLRGVAHDHQQRNAEVVMTLGGCLILDQTRLDAELVTSVRQFLNDPVKAKKTAKSLHSLYTPSSSGHIAKIMMNCVAGDGTSA